MASKEKREGGTMPTADVIALCNNVAIAVASNIREATVNILEETPKPTRADVYQRISISDIVEHHLAKEIGKLVLSGYWKLES